MSVEFGYDTQVVDMPIPLFVGVLLTAGVAYLGLPSLVRHSDFRPNNYAASRSEGKLLALVIGAGLIARAILCTSEPMLEDDYQRYLWDGAVVVNGGNPYRYAPEAVIDAGVVGPLGPLAARAGSLLDRIGHPHLTTLYPPGAQAMFALAHVIEPFSLGAWRAVIVAFDIATFALLLALLRTSGRSPLWVALYWWNPVVIKELFNAAHMDGLVMPFVLAALLVADRRPKLATCAIGVAVSIKLWPIILLPLIWRPKWGEWRALLGLALTFAPFALFAVSPQIIAGLERDAGLVAYASSWSRNSALYPALESGIGALLAVVRADRAYAPLFTRGLIVCLMALATLALAWRPVIGRDDRLARATWTVGALVLLSPAQYPWYTVWLAPLLVLQPITGFLLLPAVLPLYELYFYYAARDATPVFTGIVVWLIWIPVWGTLLLVDARPFLTRHWPSTRAITRS
jgi:alpha-1,6-mannosyltransferase